MNRNINADLIKSFSIFGVVFIHSAFLIEEAGPVLFLVDFFRFAVPCFIIIWALFLEKSFYKKLSIERRTYIVERFKHLFKVFFIWSLIYFLISVDWNELSIMTFFTKHFSGYGWAGQYFFIILFQLLLLYPLLRRLYEIKTLRIITILALFLVYAYWGYFFDEIPDMLIKVGDRLFIFWVPYVFLGIAFAKIAIKESSKIFFLAPLLIPLEFFVMNRLDLSHTPYITIAVLIASCLWTTAVLRSRPLNISDKLKKICLFIGGNTLIIFVVNPLIVFIAKYFLDLIGFYETIVDFPSWVKLSISFLMIILVFITTLGIAKMLQNTRLLKLLF